MTETDYAFAVNLMQFLVVPTFVLDSDGKVLIWNRACERLTGVPGSEVIGTKEHWRAFYTQPRACLADLIVENRLNDMEALYLEYEDANGQAYGIHAENWCVMPRLAHSDKLYLAIDAGPIYDGAGALIAVVETLRDMTAQKLAQTTLEGLAYHDALTGIYNRRAFDEKIKIEWERSLREQSGLALLMIDVDYFKKYNDHYGHQAGDECLRALATAMAQCIARPNDMLARYGGEEFAIILPSCDEAGVRTIAQRLQEHIAALQLPHQSSEVSALVTVSIGAVQGVARQLQSVQAFVAAADKALYRAKNQGRNRISF